MKADFHPVMPTPGHTEEFLRLASEHSFVKRKIFQLNKVSEKYWERHTKAGKIWIFLEKVNNILQKKAEEIEHKLEPISM